MATIVPAILGETFGEVKEKLEKVKGLTEWVQIDINDGIFSTPITWSRPLDLWEPEELPKIELHFMVEDPYPYLRDWVSASVDRIVLHAESKGDLKDYFKRIRENGPETGLALLLDTDISAVEPYIEHISLIQLMSIAKIGSYGEPFSERVLPKIHALREKYPNVTISIDGGVTLETGKRAIESGANQLVVGSGIFKVGDIKKSIEDFRSI